ncbi:phosphatidylserine decarboxylase [Gemmatimonadota bacterium]
MKPGLRMAPEGWPFVLIGTGLTAVLGIVGWGLLPEEAFLRLPLQLAAVVVGALSVFSVFFFRDPLRIPPGTPGLVLAPADGLVLRVEEVEEPSVLQGPATRISTFLSIFDVHVQRAPTAGTVVHKEYKPGRYLAAWNPKASEENEQATLGFSIGVDRFLVRQIAGLVARRVVTDPKEGDRVEQGDRIGLIRFGSRVDLVIPSHWAVECKRGDRVLGGGTVLARIPALGGDTSQEEKRT